MDKTKRQLLAQVRYYGSEALGWMRIYKDEKSKKPYNKNSGWGIIKKQYNTMMNCLALVVKYYKLYDEIKTLLYQYNIFMKNPIIKAMRD